MGLAIRHSSDLIDLPPVRGLSFHRESGSAVMARLQGRPAEAMEARFADGHQAWIASLDGEPAAWGWLATRTAQIGELGLTFDLPPRDRYLWNFVTLPAFRGRGVYPRLLDAMVRSESARAHRFWIAYAPENHASAAGIRRAGFEPVAELSFDRSGRPALTGDPLRAAPAAALLGLSLHDDSLTACWRCVRSGTPPDRSCRSGSCACDYQIATS